jgi:hypothetical protein
MGAARPVCAGDPSEPFLRGIKALCDPVEGHELQVILMSSDSEMRRSGDRRILGETVRDEEIEFAGGRAHEASDFSDNAQKSQTAELRGAEDKGKMKNEK